MMVLAMKAPMLIIQDTEPKTEESVANSACILVVLCFSCYATCEAEKCRCESGSNGCK